MTPGERAEFLRPRLANGYKVSRDDIVVEARRFAEFAEPARSLALFQLGIVLQSSRIRADDLLTTRLSGEYPWVSEGLRLNRLGRHFRLPGIPVVDRLPLALDRDTRIFFLDLETHDAPGEVGWVRGEAEANFLIESSRVMSSVGVRLTNGDRPNLAKLASTHGLKFIELAPGQSILETLDVGPGALFDGKCYWKISVESWYGHFPILTRRGPDTRYLGVHVTFHPGAST